MSSFGRRDEEAEEMVDVVVASSSASSPTDQSLKASSSLPASKSIEHDDHDSKDDDDIAQINEDGRDRSGSSVSNISSGSSNQRRRRLSSAANGQRNENPDSRDPGARIASTSTSLASTTTNDVSPGVKAAIPRVSPSPSPARSPSASSSFASPSPPPSAGSSSANNNNPRVLLRRRRSSAATGTTVATGGGRKVIDDYAGIGEKKDTSPNKSTSSTNMASATVLSPSSFPFALSAAASPADSTPSSSSSSSAAASTSTSSSVFRSITPSSKSLLNMHHITVHEEDEEEEEEEEDAGSDERRQHHRQQQRRRRAATTVAPASTARTLSQQPQQQQPGSSSSGSNSNLLSASLGYSSAAGFTGSSRPGLAGSRRQTTTGGGGGSGFGLSPSPNAGSSSRAGSHTTGGANGKKKIIGNRPASRSISTVIGGSPYAPSTTTASLSVPGGGAASTTTAATSSMSAGGNPRAGLTRRISTPMMRPQQQQQPQDMSATTGAAEDDALRSTSTLGLVLGPSPPTSKNALASGSSSTRPAVYRSMTPTRYMPVATPVTPPLSPSSPSLPSLRLPPPTMANPSTSNNAAVNYPPQPLRTPAGSLAELVEEPSTAAAAGGLLSGAWYLGKAATTYAAQALGVIPVPPPSASSRAAGDAYEDDSEDWRRRRAWITMGKKRGSGSESDDSEKGSVEDEAERSFGAHPPRNGATNAANDDERASSESYFSLRTDGSDTGAFAGGGTLPTPALNAVSLSGKNHRQHNALRPSPPPRIDFSIVRSLFFGSRATSNSTSNSRASPTVSSPQQKANQYLGEPNVSGSGGGVGGRPRSASAVSIGGLELAPGQTVRFDVALRAVVTEVGWSLLALGVVFLLSFGLVAVLVTSLPIHSLRSLPTKVSDLQVLSTEIKQYMAASRTGWWHVICTLLVTGLWKHAWSVPGAVILNILVGSLMSPIPAVALLTVITSFGSLGAYMISRPLAPLIALVFPKPLALVRSALGSSRSEGRWRRLLVMRAMGLVPWSGMNVACGVVGVSPVVFLLTTAAGSASWSYVTASVGDIISHMGQAGGATADGSATLTSLIRDPAMIFKMVVLSGLSLVPVLFKSRSSNGNPASSDDNLDEDGLGDVNATASSSIISPVTRSMTPLAPTPSIYQTASLIRAVFRKLLRRTGLGARSGFGSAAQAVEEELRSFLPHQVTPIGPHPTSVSQPVQAQVQTQQLSTSAGASLPPLVAETSAISTSTGRPRATSVGRARASSRAGQ